MGVQIVAVSVDPPELNLRSRRLSKATFTFVTDSKGGLIDLFGLRHVGANPDDGSDIARSASALIDAQGKVLWFTAAPNYRVRPKPQDVLEAVRTALGE